MELLARTCKTEVMNVQRIMARLFVIVGALFWGFAAWGAKWAYEGAPFTTAMSYGALFAAAILVVFVIGLFFENLAAAILLIASLGVIVAGFVGRWETGVWAVVLFFFVLPLVIAGVLYLMAARMQKICEGSS